LARQHRHKSFNNSVFSPPMSVRQSLADAADKDF